MKKPGNLALSGTPKLRQPRVVWRSWYTIYSIGCLGFLLWMLVGTIIQAGRRAARNHYRFDGSLHIIATTVLFVKVLANTVSVVAGSRKSLAFHVRAAEFERRTRIPACTCCRPRRYFWSDLRQACLLVVYCAAFAAAVPLTPQSNVVVDYRHRPIWTQVYTWLQFIITIVFYFVYDSIHIVALQSAGQVVVEYMKSQLKVLEGCLSQASAVQLPHHSRDVQRHLEAIRLNFCEILELKAAINEVWSWSLVISTACTLLVLCTSAYEVCKNGPAKWDNYAAFVYSVYIAYRFVALAVVSQSLIDAIQYLHGCIDPEELCLTGGAFFKLNMPLLVSMAAAIITYTVILVQTSQSFTMSASMSGSVRDLQRAKRSAIGPFTVDVAPAHDDIQGGLKGDKHKPSEHSHMLRSFALQARLCRLCGFLFVQDIFAKPPRSPKIVWLHWYSLYAAACFAFFLWFEIDVVTRDAIELSDTHRFFTKSLLVLLHVVVIVKASGNFLTMIFGCRRMLDFLIKAGRFEKEIDIPACKCCSQKPFLWSDAKAALMFVLYFVSYTMALFHQEQKVDIDDQLNFREIFDRVCGFFAAVLFFAYDSVNFINLRHSVEVLERYVSFLKEKLEDHVGCKVLGCEVEAAKKVQAARLHLCTVLELKNDINGIWQRSVVVSSVGLLLVTCISLYTIITEGLKRTELWIAIGYSAFTSYEFLKLATVSQSLSNAFQDIKNSCRKTLTMDRTIAYSHQIQYLHNTINPDDMSLNGSDFFKINLGLLVSMAGSIITYTVILVQTSPDLEAPAECPSDTMTTSPALPI
ncbi:uncharacterized protein LOC144103705 [Amblyomma americanum]